MTCLTLSPAPTQARGTGDFSRCVCRPGGGAGPRGLVPYLWANAGACKCRSEKKAPRDGGSRIAARSQRTRGNCSQLYWEEQSLCQPRKILQTNLLEKI